MSLHPQHPPAARISLLSLALCSAFAGPAWAQQNPDSKPASTPQTLGTVVISGQAAGLRSALDKQQAAQGVSSVVHADGIGQLPDNNAAEALARLPGVSVERDQGEGRFIRVRGLGPDLNAVSINGSLVPSAEADRRAVGLDVVPAGLIRSLEISKTLTPEQDANSLGGAVAVQTLSAFDLPGRFLTLEAGANHDHKTGKSKPRAALIYSERLLGQRLGLALALSSDARSFGSDNVETGGAWSLDSEPPKLEELERRKYSIKRERQGAALNLDWRPAAGRSLYLRSFSSRFTDTEQRQGQAISFDKPQAEGQLGAASVKRSLKAREEINRISALSLGGELKDGDWTLQAELGGGAASENKPGALAGADFKGSFKDSGFSDSRRPVLLAPAALEQAANYSLDKIKLEDSLARDRERHLRLDLQHEGDWAGLAVDLKGGLKFSRRSKRNEQETYAFSAKTLAKAPYKLDKAQLAMSSFLSGSAVDYRWGSFGPALSEEALRGLLAPLDRKAFRDEEDSRVNDFRIDEDVDAAYLQATVQQGANQWLLGLRHEALRTRLDGTGARDGSFETVQRSSSSRHWLPALLLRRQLASGLLGRAALTHGVVRPTFGQLAPGFVVDGEEAEFGNPELKPLRARNLDLGLEQRLGSDGALSAALFHKNIRDFVYRTDLAGSGRWVGFDSAISYANGDKASVRGLELSYNQALRSLPAPFNGLVLGANATLVKSSARIAGYKNGQLQSRKLALPSQSDRSFNLSLGWEGHGLSTRLAANSKSRYLLEVGDVLDAARDAWVDAQTQIDFSLRYQLTPQLQLSFEALNLGDSAYYVYSGRKALNAQYEQYGRSFKLGLKLAVF